MADTRDASKTSRSAGFYKSYNFIDKDPVIDEIRTLIQDEQITYAEIERRSGVVASTLKNWFEGRTKRPQHATIRAVVRAVGFDYAIVALDRNTRMEVFSAATPAARAVPTHVPSLTAPPAYTVPKKFLRGKALQRRQSR